MFTEQYIMDLERVLAKLDKAEKVIKRTPWPSEDYLDKLLWASEMVAKPGKES